MSEKEILDRVEQLINAEKAQDALSQLQRISEGNSVRFYLLKGKIEQKFQNWGKAINAYNRVLEIDKQNEEAKNNLQLIQNILSFWNPDMHNP